ncbi:MAG: hypothetical protein KY446_04785 [Proteobacteria bacterium]|nr:hypothetical protein [Pseudomonadota bacterium]MBW3617058.1 hypothetical protein [Pseudomonadota bacterium]
MLIPALVLLLAGAAPAAQDPSARTQALTALPSSDLDIQRALWAAYQTTPNKSVCVNRTLTGSRQPRQVCGTLDQWFRARTPSEVSRNEPPFQLVEGIKDQRRKAMVRGGGGSAQGAGGR